MGEGGGLNIITILYRCYQLFIIGKRSIITSGGRSTEVRVNKVTYIGEGEKKGGAELLSGRKKILNRS